MLFLGPALTRLPSLCRNALAATTSEVLLVASAPALAAPGDGRARRLFAAVRDLAQAAAAGPAQPAAISAEATAGASALALLLTAEVRLTNSRESFSTNE